MLGNQRGRDVVPMTAKAAAAPAGARLDPRGTPYYDPRVIESHDTVIVGGGHTALALSYHLTRLGREHVILERGRLAERWRSERWDSLTFQFPSWSIRLPGMSYRGTDPDGFAPRDEVVRFIEDYAAAIRAPVRTGVAVRRLRQKSGSARFLLDAGDTTYEAASVVVATGPYQDPALPEASRALPARVLQVHSSRYRNPGALPPGEVLVVGSGASGCQIAEDLADAGRRVHLSVGRHRRMPRRYRGRDVFWWLEQMGGLDQTIDQRGEPRPNPLVTGASGGHTIDLRRYALDGMGLCGHVRGASGERLALAPDMMDEIERGDRAYTGFTKMVDEHVARTGLDAPPEPEADPLPAPPEPPLGLDLHAAGITVVVWATGFRYDFGWIDPPVLDAAGDPVHRRGVTRCPGLYFLGLPWLWKLKSSVLCGVGEDAEHIAEHITKHIGGARRAGA